MHVIILKLNTGVTFVDLLSYMDPNYQQLDLYSLLDLLATETEKYTKAFTSGDLSGTENSRTKVNALITEIIQRKQKGLLSPEIEVKSSSEYPSDPAPTTM